MNEGAAQTASVSLGKGAWDCDLNVAIPPEKEVSSATAICIDHIDTKESHAEVLQAEVFEEIATMDYPFEGIPTVPPRKDMDHMVRAAEAEPYKTW